jgi:hypothetical protein
MYKKNREILTTKLITPLLPLYEQEFPLIFFWSPKSGCTSLIKWFFFQIELLQKAIDYNPEGLVHLYRIEVYETQQNYKLKIAEQLLDDKKDVYKLVRNPYSRAVSSFLSTFVNENIMNQVAPADIHNGLSFKKFLYQVKNIGVARGLIDAHIAQQYVEEEELFIQNYVHLEHFTNKIRDIEKKYNLLESPILNIIKSPHHKAQKMTVKGKQTFAEVNMSVETLRGPIPEYKNFYDDETRDLVRELFKKDFEKYGYNQYDLN